MEKRKEPKFKKGDTVVITMYGTVGNITDVTYIDGTYVYEVNHSKGLYIESTLQYISEYKGEVLLDKEHIDIEYKFFFGDLVQVEGYGGDYFKVNGFRTEIWRYKENSWEDVIYELSRISDGEWLEAHEEELTLIADAERADTIIQKLGLLHPINQKPVKKDQNDTPPASRKSEKERIELNAEKKQLIDGLLDLYNDYQILYKMYEDDEYRQVMDLAMMKIKVIAGEVHHKGKRD
ncbi:hypothetical protein ELQ35_00415 [Peribacillus cavernae]|uniref:YodN n=1 Tax=Peribacillus cavernae TaxID=1674310 RepID=A0A433HWD4_9BACI|nr:hypothetical protein [Peribacillus cavernae]MDQ0217948.1 hypothetical protein [Peribacillus cavernae]RUQ32596.1 hypothetical protein ELQ35_00415 [Peribacillus cavernae]